MSLHFPLVETIHLARPPLREVVCQVKFPSILSIAHKEPAEFQEKIRQDFPLFDVEQGILFAFDGELPTGRVKAPPQTYHFSNRDRTYKVSLSVGFYALSTTHYQGWHDFARYLGMVTDAVRSVYAIDMVSRVGLRYVNMMDESFTETGAFEDVLMIVRDELTAMLRVDVIQEHGLAVQRIETRNNEENFSFQFGLIYEGEQPERRFVLDFDYFIQNETSLDDLLERCDRYHQIIYQAFRWCIAEGKLGIFQPL